jgi:hypothetical protein
MKLGLGCDHMYFSLCRKQLRFQRKETLKAAVLNQSVFLDSGRINQLEKLVAEGDLKLRQVGKQACTI